MRRFMIFWLLLLFASACNSGEDPAATGFVRGAFAYISAKNRVLVLNIADEAKPALVADVTLPGEVVKVVVDGRFLYIVHNPSVDSWPTDVGPPDAGLQIVDTSEPTEPKLLGFFRTHNLPTDVAINGDVAYLADWERIAVVDVGDKDDLTSHLSLTAGANGVFIDDMRLFASQGGCSFRSGFCSGRLNIYDVSNPRRPSPTGSLPVDELPGYDVFVANRYAFVAGKGVWVVEVEDEADLTVNGRYEVDQDSLYPAKIVIQGNTAYSLHGDGLHLLDVSQPTAPALLGRYHTDNYLQDLAVQGDTVFLVGWNGLEIINVAAPTNPQQIGSFAFANPIPSAPQPTATP